MSTDSSDTAIDGAETAIPPVDLPGFWLHFDRRLVGVTKAAVFAIGAAFTIMVSLEVASRFLLNQSMSMTNGLARFLLVWFFMLGAGLALRQGGHIGLDILTRKLPPVPSTVLYFIAQTLILTFLVQLGWGGYLALGASFTQIEGSLGISLAWVMSAFPIGFALLIYHQAALVTSTIRGLAAGRAPG